jgi:hypothetical protein
VSSGGLTAISNLRRSCRRRAFKATPKLSSRAARGPDCWGGLESQVIESRFGNHNAVSARTTRNHKVVIARRLRIHKAVIARRLRRSAVAACGSTWRMNERRELRSLRMRGARKHRSPGTRRSDRDAFLAQSPALRRAAHVLPALLAP